MIDSIRLSWWNTGLAPRARPCRDQKRYDQAGIIIDYLLHDEEIDLLALGEITEEDITACSEKSRKRLSSLSWRTPSEPNDRASALAVAFDSAKLALVDQVIITDRFAGVAYSTGWHLTFELRLGGDPFNVIVVHWPSHLVEEAERKRRWIANSLHRAVSQYRDVVIMGDFNDEPFCNSLLELAAYRDRNLVRRKEQAFYNPFWRLLGEQQHFEHEHPRRLPAGTHYYRSGGSSRWFTFDQILVSSAMITSSKWRLLEGATRVVLHDSLLTPQGAMRANFDHLPIAATVSHLDGA